MNIQDLSPSQVKAFHEKLGKSFGIRFINSGIVANYVRGALERIAMPFMSWIPQSVFELRPCAFWRLVLLPYQPGTESVSASSQISVAIHEATHCRRLLEGKNSTANWYDEYFFKKPFRAMEEIAARGSVCDVVYWALGRFPAITLNGYWLREKDIELAKDTYEKRKEQLKRSGRGSSFDPVSKRAIEILRELGVKPQ